MCKALPLSAVRSTLRFLRGLFGVGFGVASGVGSAAAAATATAGCEAARGGLDAASRDPISTSITTPHQQW
jgi:hypothetical protein